MPRTVLNLDLETVTPMFLHGYDKRTPELRTPPFKALFRYWWRATQSEDNSASLLDQEGKIFGDTNQKSPLLMRILVPGDLRKGDYQPLPHHTGQRKCKNCEDKPANEKCKKGYKRKVYIAGGQFTIRFIACNLNRYEKIARLSFLLGGVGNRSRRGFGSIRETAWNFSGITNLQGEVLASLNSVAGKTRFGLTGGIIKSKQRTHYPPEYPVVQCIFFGEPTETDDVDSLLKKIGQATHDHKDDALGFAKGRKRLASPVHIRIQKTDSGYIPIATQLASKYSKSVKQRQFIDAIIT